MRMLLKSAVDDTGKVISQAITFYIGAGKEEPTGVRYRRQTASSPSFRIDPAGQIKWDAQQSRNGLRDSRKCIMISMRH